MHRKPLYLALCAGLLTYPLSGFSQHSLPSLGKGEAIDKGKHAKSLSDFTGGIAVDGKPFANEATLLLSKDVDVRGSITVAPEHQGQTADLVVYAGYKMVPTGDELFFTLRKTPEGGLEIPVWNRQPENLAVFETVTLSAVQDVPMYQSKFILPGRLAVHFGYRIKHEDGTVTLVFNSYPINIVIQNDPPSSGAEGGTSSPTPETPPQFIASYDFRPSPNGYSFENYGNDQQSATDLSAEDMIKLFGQAKVCRSPEGECVLTAAAQQWMEEQIKGMNGGHCEGMAVTSLYLRQGLNFKGKTTPADFQVGANSTYDLQKAATRNFIAYYFVTQALQPLANESAAVRQKKPSEIVQMLIESMNQGLNNPYTLGFYQPGYKGGHAVTPYAVEQKGPEDFWIYVYDNNYPNATNRAIKVNRTNETWVYEGAATNPNEPASDYRGDASTKTLELTGQSLRNGPFECPFCTSGGTRQEGDNTVEFSLIGEGKIQIQMPDGRRVGYDFDTGLEVNDIAGAMPIFGKYGLGKDIPPTYEVPIPADNAPFTVFISGKTLDGETEADLMMTGPGYVVGFEEIYLDPEETLIMHIYPDGHIVSFTASQDGETPSMFLAQDPANDTDPGYLFEVDGMELEADKTVTFTLEGDSLYIEDDDGNADEYDLTITRIDDQGPDQFVKEDVVVGAGANARLEFGNWDGENGTVNWQEDDDGDGFDDEEVNPLENARSKKTP